MELTEPIESINNQLIHLFGIDTITGMPIWRVVWSNDQYEKRLGTYDDITESGIYLRTVTEVREVPKYSQWLPNLYVLERLVVVPEINQDELPTSKISYEPLFPFWDKDGKALPPKLEVAKFVIDTIYAAQYGTHNLKKYKDDEDSQEASLELKKKRIDEISEYLWGDQPSFHDALINGEAVTLNSDYKES